MRCIEERSAQAGVSTDTLMENAGLAVAERVRHHLGQVERVPILVLIGPGNNGGDGLVTARHLQAWGASTTVYLCRGRQAGDPNIAAVLDQAPTVVHASGDDGLARLRDALDSTHMVVDAVLGTGRSRPIEGLLRDILLSLTATRVKRPDLRLLALDLPTGLDADTGAVDPTCPRADVTVALGYPKAGHYIFPGAEYSGTIETVDIGVPAGLDGDVTMELMTRDWAAVALPSRPVSAHKGTFGKTLLVAGSTNYVGAAYLAAAAAGRSGAGLVTLATPQSLQMAVVAKAPEPTYLPLAESSPGVYSLQAADQVLESAPEYDSLLVGCGIGQAAETRQMLDRLLYSEVPLPPTIVDADALNLLALSGDAPWWERFSAPAVVTPHPGEMARLVGLSTEAVQKDRTGTATEAAARWNKVVALKGAHTVVAFPSGQTMLSPFANPALATAGTGDVLAGTIAGLLAQGLSLEDGAALGVYLHGAAGERVSDELGDTGLLASDLLMAIPKAIKDLKIGVGG